MTDLIHDLNSRAHDAGAAPKRDILEAALEVSKAVDSQDRGWALVHLAAALRDHERYQEALAFLDLVDQQFSDPELMRAVFTCAIAVHGDRNEIRVANSLCDQQRERMPADVHFLRAEIRARLAWLEETGEEAAATALHRAQTELALISGDLISAS